MNIAVLCGGVGAARLLDLCQTHEVAQMQAIVNVGDDEVIHGLSISPDLDTIMYTLAGAIDPERGWGLRNETWTALNMLREICAANRNEDQRGWFALGDRDLGTHLYRTSRLVGGDRLTAITQSLCHYWKVNIPLLPVTESPIRTRLQARDGKWMTFQEYFVQEHHQTPIQAVKFTGADTAHPTAAVRAALTSADAIVIAPSNPIVSIGPILAIEEVRSLVKDHPKVIAVSPLIGGAALKGPAAELMAAFDFPADAAGIAQWYGDLISDLIIDSVDTHLAEACGLYGAEIHPTPTLMSDPSAAAALADTLGRILNAS